MGECQSFETLFVPLKTSIVTKILSIFNCNRYQVDRAYFYGLRKRLSPTDGQGLMREAYR